MRFGVPSGARRTVNSLPVGPVGRARSATEPHDKHPLTRFSSLLSLRASDLVDTVALAILRARSERYRDAVCLPVGRSQVVRQRILIPPFGGSSPPAPANILKGLRAVT
jgi:hypothetical protein